MSVEVRGCTRINFVQSRIYPTYIPRTIPRTSHIHVSWDVRDVRGMVHGTYAGVREMYMGCTRFNFHPIDICAYTMYSPRDLCFLPTLLLLFANI